MELALILLFALWVIVCVIWPFLDHRPRRGSVVEVPYGPNDLLVIQSETRLSLEQVDRLKADIQRSLDEGASVMVLDRGLSVKVLHRPQDDEPLAPEAPVG